MQEEKKAQKTHGSLEKGVRLLTAFMPDNKEMGVMELAKKFSMNRSTVSRMLTVLKRQGFVLQNPENKRYSLGPVVASLGAAYRRSFQSTVVLLAKPYLDQLRNEINNTVVLALPSGDDIIIAHVAEGLGPIKVAAQVGDRRHYHATSDGKCLLAFSSPSYIDKVLLSPLLRMTPKTIVDPEHLRKELKKIHQQGFSFDCEGNFLGISAFSVPLLNMNHSPIAAITIASPSGSVTWKEKNFFVERLKSTAATLSSLLVGDTVSL